MLTRFRTFAPVLTPERCSHALSSNHFGNSAARTAPQAPTFAIPVTVAVFDLDPVIYAPIRVPRSAFASQIALQTVSAAAVRCNKTPGRTDRGDEMKIGDFDARNLAVAACLLTCGCGGGGGGGLVVGTPSSPSYDSFVGLNKNITVQTTSTAANFTYNTLNGIRADTITRDAKGGFGEGGITISYDAASQTYTIHDGPNALSYGPADKDPSGPGPSQSPFETYFHQVGNNLVDKIKAYRAGSAGTQFPQLSYATFVVASREAITLIGGISDANINARVIYAIGGFETVRSDLPRTGTASYTSYVTGAAIGPDREYPVEGSVSITADFANASVSTALALKSGGQGIGNFNGVAPIDSGTSRFKGDLTANGTTQGSFSGSFFGPQAAEVGYTYRVQTSIGTVDGGAVGKK